MYLTRFFISSSFDWLMLFSFLQLCCRLAKRPAERTTTAPRPVKLSSGKTPVSIPTKAAPRLKTFVDLPRTTLVGSSLAAEPSQQSGVPSSSPIETTRQADKAETGEREAWP